MPRPEKAARAFYRADRDRWFIRDAGRQHGTGVSGKSNRGAAEQALADYIASKIEAPSGPAYPASVLIGRVLQIYARGRGPEVVDRERLGYAIKALTPFWANLACDAVRGETCRRYVKSRGVAETTARRELNTLQSALRYAVKEGYLIHAPVVTLPPKGQPKERWLTEEEAAKLMQAAKESENPGLYRFILIALDTGTRAKSILRLRWTESLDSGWVDLQNGILYRRGVREAATKKKREPVRMTDRLMREMEVWERGSSGFVIEWRGKPISRIKNALTAACERAGIDRITPHDLKRTSVTWAFQRGMSIEDAVEFFSTSPDTLLRTYRQHSPRHQERAVSIMNRE